MLRERIESRVPVVGISLLITVLLPLLAGIALRVPLRAIPVAAAAAGINVLFRIDTLDSHGTAGRRARIAILLLLAAWMAHIVITILIIPFSIYMTWFRLVELGQQRGPVSQVLVSAIGFFAAVICGRIYRGGIAAPAATLMVLVLLTATIVFHSVVPLLIAAPLVALALATGRAACGSGSLHVDRSGTATALRAGVGLVVVALLVGGMLGMPRAARGNRYIDNRLSPLLRRSIVRVFPDYPLLYGGDGYGYSFDQVSLGGRPLLSSVPILEVTARPGERIYLRTDIYDHYSGTSWLRTEDLLARLQEPSNDITVVPGGDSQTAPLPITILTEFYEKLPHTLTTRALSTVDNTGFPAILGHPDVGYHLAMPLGSGDSFVLQRSLGESPAYDRNLRRNLQLPDGIPPEVRVIARDLGRGVDDPRDVLSAVTAYLADGFEYSLETNPTLEEVDFVHDFLLDSRTGYCVHFATSLVVLARMNDIPARYVTGFLVSIPYMDDYADLLYEMASIEDEHGRVQHRVTGYAAHAWPEVWLPDTGWVVWEATPAMRAGEYDDAAFLRALQDPDSLTSRQLRAILGYRAESEPQRDTGDRRNPDSWYALLMIPGFTLAGAAVVGVRRRILPVIDTRRALDSVAQRLTRAARRRSVSPPQQIGWRAWCHDATRLLPERRRHALYSGTELIQRTLFGGYRPTRGDITELHALERELKRSQARFAKRRERRRG